VQLLSLQCYHFRLGLKAVASRIHKSLRKDGQEARAYIMGVMLSQRSSARSPFA
jgi:hypothetical protein